MNKIKNKRIKEQKSTMIVVLLVSSVLFFSAGLLIKDNESKTIMLTLSAGLFAGTLIATAFKGKFGYKPTREEIENDMFEKNAE